MAAIRHRLAERGCPGKAAQRLADECLIRGKGQGGELVTG